jgi:hypothetical protein
VPNSQRCATLSDPQGLTRPPTTCRKKYGFTPLGGPTGAVKTAVFSSNNMRLYGVQKRSDLGDRFATMKEEYLPNGAARSNLRYGYARRPEAQPT